MTEFDPAEIMDYHAEHGGPNSMTCHLYAAFEGDHCYVYRLAEVLAAEQAKVARVEAVCASVEVESCFPQISRVNIRDIRAALVSQPEQP